MSKTENIVQWVDIRKCSIKTSGEIEIGNSKVFNSLEDLKKEYGITDKGVPYFAEPIIKGGSNDGN